MKEFKLFMNEYIIIANVLLFLCYNQSNMLMFRLIFIAACLFLLINSLTTPIISIDIVIFNILFVIINAHFAKPLIMKMVPPNFSKEQKKLHINYFNNFMQPTELSNLLIAHSRKHYKVPTKLIKSGNEFHRFSLLQVLVKIVVLN